MQKHTIVWTKTDESPAMSSYSLLPIVKAFTNTCDINISVSDISLASRILALFPDRLTKKQQQDDDLDKLKLLIQTPDANIIKLPNISASVPQLKKCIKELQEKGYNIPDFSDNPTTPESKQIHTIYKKVLGSAVNPVLRDGNSDREVPKSIKNYTKKFPHKMSKWDKDSLSHISTMSSGDFRANEISTTLTKDTKATITLHSANGEKIILKDNISLLKGDIIDSTFMSIKALNKFLKEQIQDAKEKNVLFSIHLKATMMKVTDPIIFGHCVKTYYKEAINKNTDILEKLGVNFNNGLSDLYSKITKLDKNTQSQIISDFDDVHNNNADIAMVDSTKGITNLHIPSDVIVDASMADAIRNGGKMWNKNNKQQDTKFTIPDSTYAPLYDETIKDLIQNGQLDPTTIGTVQNVGLMAKKAEEYGSHDTSFEIQNDGEVVIADQDGNIIHSQKVEKSDIYRMVRVQDAPIQDWVKLAVKKAKITKYKTIFWLDDDRPHTRELIKKVELYLKDYDTNGLDIEIMSTKNAAKISIQRMRKAQNTISATGNILRDYNTDLYPILELGTSAKMLSTVSLARGGGLFETGAGGSAPKLIQKLQQKNFLEWDSLGEFLALETSLQEIAMKKNQKSKILASCLNQAIQNILDNQKSPKKEPIDIDNRGSHFYLALYWADALAVQNDDKALSDLFKNISKQLNENEENILEELLCTQNKSVDFQGYYILEDKIANNIMRPSQTLNKIIDSI